MSIQRPTNGSAADWHGLTSLVRLVLAFFTITSFMWFGGIVFAGLKYQEVARSFLEQHPTLKIIPFPQFYAVLLQTESWRFCLAPLGAMITIFCGAAFFVKDIYALVRLREAVHYIITSMFALFFPQVNVEGGSAHFVKGKPNLLEDVGGPGWCTIQPGNVVMFHNLREHTNITIGESYFLAPFEKIGHITNLDDQHDSRTNVGAISRDGIKITIKDIHFRYRILQQNERGQTTKRSQKDPYPFNATTLWRMTNNLTVSDRGLETWREAIGRTITGVITDFIFEHTLDHVTAPRENSQNPRLEIRSSLFSNAIRNSLRENGAELLWVDMGHFSIDEDIVDETRQNLWAAESLGDAQVTRELGLVKREIYRDLGRAEAQAGLIDAIAEALKLADKEHDTAYNMRRILLVKTAELLDSYRIESRKALEGKNR